MNVTKSKAYSYLRFSTPEQLKGDSLRRQYEGAIAYAAAHQLELDTELRYEDKGVSGFSGANVRKGALGQFLAAVDDGIVEPGSYLLVENLDRMSRQDPWEALPLFQQIINAGITIVTLQDGRVYSREAMQANRMLILESIFVMIRANEESETKSRRLRAVWENKRSNASAKRLSKIAPAWLQTKGDGFELIPDRAEVVRRIFQMALDGVGQNLIAQTLNNEQVPTFGRAAYWQRSYILKILTNPAVVGVYVPHTIEYVGHKRQRVPQTPIENYYPPVISKDTYSLVTTQREGIAAPRGRHAARPIQNPLAGLAKCPKCGGTMTRVNKGSAKKAGKPFLVCIRAKTGAGCEYHGVSLELIEDALRFHADRIVGEAPSGDDGEALVSRIISLEAEMDELSEEAVQLVEVLKRGHSDTAVSELQETEELIDRLRVEIRKTEQQIIQARGQMTGQLIANTKNILANGTPHEVNTALKQLLSSVVVDYEQGRLDLVWRHGGETEVYYGVPRGFRI